MKARTGRLLLAALALPVLTACTPADALSLVGASPAVAQETGPDLEPLEESLRWNMDASNDISVMAVICHQQTEKIVLCKVQEPKGNIVHYGVAVAPDGTYGDPFKVKGEKVASLDVDAATKAAAKASAKK